MVGGRTMAEVDPDALAHCAGKLGGVRDVANMAASCKAFRHAAYYNSVWRPLFRERWPTQQSTFPSHVSAREEYLRRHLALLRFEYCNPYTQVWVLPTSCSHVFLDKEAVVFATSAFVYQRKLDDRVGKFSYQVWGGHKARITCMRQFPVSSTTLLRNVAENDDSFFASSSCDGTIRLWWKGKWRQTLQGHNGPVTTIADELVDDCSGKLLASGGEDGTVRLWSLSSTGTDGQIALRSTLYGHEKPVVLLSVPGFNASRLISVSEDAKVRLWDTNSSSTTRSSQCLGMACVNGDPIALKCHELLCYVAIFNTVTAIDLRTMRSVSTVAVDQSKLHSLQILPSKSLICTGGSGRSMLWDVRKSGSILGPVLVLDGHEGDVTHIHMDSYRIVTGGPQDSWVKVWQTDTGGITSTLNCLQGNPEHKGLGLTAMAVNGYRIVTSCGEEHSVSCYRDFTHSSHEHVPCNGTT